MGDAVCVQNILERHDAHQRVYIGAAHYRQQIDLVAAHPLQRQVQPLIGVHVGKGLRIDQLAELPVRSLRTIPLDEVRNRTSNLARCRMLASNRSMGRNLFILAASLALFALISCGVAYSNIAQQPGSPGDASLWRTMGLALFVLALLAALAGVLLSLFEQARRRSEETSRRRRS